MVGDFVSLGRKDITDLPTMATILEAQMNRFPKIVVLVDSHSADAVVNMLLESENIGQYQPLVIGKLDGPHEAGDADAAIIDLTVGGAIEVADSIRDLALPIVAVVPDYRTGREALAYGASDYLIKGSLNGSILLRSILYVVEMHRRVLAESGLLEVTNVLTTMKDTLSGLRDEIRQAQEALAVVQKQVTLDYTV